MPSLSQILKSKIGNGGKSKTYVANELKVTEKTIENYMHGKRKPKPSALIKLSKMLGFSLDELSNDEDLEQIVPREIDQNDISTDHSLQYFIHSNKTLIDATLERAKEQRARSEADRAREEKEKMLVQSNIELQRMLKAIERVPEYNPLGDPATLAKLLEILADLGVGKLWKTKEDGLIAVGNFLGKPESEVKNQENIHSVARKKSTEKL